MSFYIRTGRWALIPIAILTLSGCPVPADPDLTGDWHIKEEGCLELCAFHIKTDKVTGKRFLTFEDKSLLAERATGILMNASGNGYALRFSGGGEIGFELKDGNLVAEEGSVFERMPSKAFPG